MVLVSSLVVVLLLVIIMRNRNVMIFWLESWLLLSLVVSSVDVRLFVGCCWNFVIRLV